MAKVAKILFYILCGLPLLFISADLVKAANIEFGADTQLNFSGVSPAIYINSGSACDYLYVSTTGLIAEVPSGSTFTLETTSQTVVGLTPSGASTTLYFNIANLSSGYLTEWIASSSLSTATSSFSAGVPVPNSNYSVKVNGVHYDNYLSNSSGIVTFNYTGGFGATTTFTVARNSPGQSSGGSTGGGALPTTPVTTTSTETATTTTPVTPPTTPTTPTTPAVSMTADGIKNEIARITALILQLQSQLKEMQGTQQILGIPGDFTFKNTLKFGMVSSDVKYLQLILNSDFQTKLADSGVGSSGKETNIFGNLTKAAVVKFQQKYASEILTPLGLKSGTGIVGKATITKLNSLLGK